MERERNTRQRGNRMKINATQKFGFASLAFMVVATFFIGEAATLKFGLALILLAWACAFMGLLGSQDDSR